MFEKIKADKRSMSLRRPVFGVGKNDSWYKTSVSINGKIERCEIYKVWVHMLERCYSEKYKERFESYRNASVCNEWLIFSNFSEWAKDKWRKGYQLDKDVKGLGSKLYSPENCIFLSPRINGLFIDSKTRRGDLPLGVSIQDGKLKVSCSDGVRQVHVGYYKNLVDAVNAYKSFKMNVVHESIKDLDPETKSIVLRYAEYYLSDDY